MGGKRTDQEAELFSRALQDMMTWYGHAKALTFKLTRLPEGYPRGFVFPKDKEEVHQPEGGRGDGGRPVRDDVQEGHGRGDRAQVRKPAVGRRADECVLEDRRQRVLGSLNYLRLHNNQIGDEGMKAFSTAIASGALANLTFLSIAGNQIGDAGMSEFSRAIASGSLGKLEKLNLYNNRIGNEGMKAFSTAIASGSLGDLQELWLNNNQIGDEGMKAFSSAIASGSLAKCKTFTMSSNPGSDAPIKKALAERKQ